MKRGLTLLAAFTLPALAMGCMSNSNASDDAGITGTPINGACMGPDGVYCYSWTNLPALTGGANCAVNDGGPGLGACPAAGATGTCTTAQGAGSTSVTSYAPFTSCTAAKSACQGTFDGGC